MAKGRVWWSAALAVLMALSVAAPAPARQSPERPAQPVCPLSAADRAWVESALEAWRRASRDALRLGDAPLPWIVLFDGTCAWNVNPGAGALPPRALGDVAQPARTTVTFAGRPVVVWGAVHAGAVSLPDGQSVPPRLMAFASTYGDAGKPYLAMALPSVWREEPRHRSEPRFDQLLRSVFVHEMTHTAHSRSAGPRIDALVERHNLGDDLDDDVVQTRFGERPGFRAAYEAERDLLFRAAAERDAARRRSLAAEALAAMKARRARFFAGADAFYAELEDVFLNMEGLANWAAYRAAVSGGMSEPDALALIRRDGRRWSQDEGLAVFLALDALAPGWQAKVLSPEYVSALDLLAEAARERHRAAPMAGRPGDDQYSVPPPDRYRGRH